MPPCGLEEAKNQGTNLKWSIPAYTDMCRGDKMPQHFWQLKWPGLELFHVLPSKVLLLTLVKAAPGGQEPARLCHRWVAMPLCPRITPSGTCHSICMQRPATQVWSSAWTKPMVCEKVYFNSFFISFNSPLFGKNNSPPASHSPRGVGKGEKQSECCEAAVLAELKPWAKR